MAKIPTFDPLSNEARSPLIAGLTTAVNKISEILDMATTQYENLPLTEVTIIEGKERLLYQASNDNRLWLNSPEPVIKVNGEIKSTGFDLDCIGGSVRFYEQLEEGAKVTATATGIIRKSEVLTNALSQLNQVQSIARHYKGYAATADELRAQYIEAADGDYAIVGETKTVWIYDSRAGDWTDTFTKTDLSDYYTSAQVDETFLSKADAESDYKTKTDFETDLKAYAVHQELD